jgi:hypothetical protein
LARAPRMPVRPEPHQSIPFPCDCRRPHRQDSIAAGAPKGARDGVWGVRRLVRGKTPVPEEIWNRRGSPAPGIARRWGKWICRRTGPRPARRHQARRSWRLRTLTGQVSPKPLAVTQARAVLLVWQLPRWDGEDGPCLAFATRSAEFDFSSKCSFVSEIEKLPRSDSVV